MRNTSTPTVAGRWHEPVGEPGSWRLEGKQEGEEVGETNKPVERVE